MRSSVLFKDSWQPTIANRCLQKEKSRVTEKRKKILSGDLDEKYWTGRDLITILSKALVSPNFRHAICIEINISRTIIIIMTIVTSLFFLHIVCAKKVTYNYNAINEIFFFLESLKDIFRTLLRKILKKNVLRIFFKWLCYLHNVRCFISEDTHGWYLTLDLTNRRLTAIYIVKILDKELKN